MIDESKIEGRLEPKYKKDELKRQAYFNSLFTSLILLTAGGNYKIKNLRSFIFALSTCMHLSSFVMYFYILSSSYLLIVNLLNIIISKYLPKLIIAMQSIFRIYAKTSKPNDKYLYKELLSYGLQPKYEDLLHSYYFNANFNQLFMLSFQAFTAQSLYVQLGHRYPLSTQVGENEKSVTEFLKKINFRSFIPLSRGIVQNTTLKLLIRQSSNHLPSENVMISLFQNYLQKQIIMKEYRKMAQNEQFSRLENYYDIKQIVEKKWQHEDGQKQEQNLLLQGKSKQNVKLIQESGGRNIKKIQQSNERIDDHEEYRQNQIANLFEVPYSPHFIMYVRRNHARLLLKINKDSMHKHGWKKNVGWGPIRQSLAASIIYRSGLNEYAKQKGSITIWDPLCGSGTIPMVALTMIKNLRVRQNQIVNFVWHKWPVYNSKYLQEYIKKIQQKSKDVRVNIFCSDIDSSAVQNTVNNFKQLISQNKSKIWSSGQEQNFIKISSIDSIYEVVPNKIYVGSGDFDKFPQKIAHHEKKVTIITNLPYLGQRSKEHHPIKQLVSIYKRFNNMINNYQQYIDNVFVVVDSDLQNNNHFTKVSSNSWTILEYLQNGGIQVCLLGWAKNSIGFREMQIYQENSNKGATIYDNEKQSNLEQYRQQIKQIQNKYYNLPKHLGPKKGLRQTKRVNEKKRVRHLQAAYEIFAKRKDKNQIYQKFARKNLALRLSQRGKTWKRRNISLVGDINEKEELIKKQFENRIEEAIKRSEQIKLRKKENNEKTKRKW